MKTRTMLLLLPALAASACTSTRTVEVVTKPAPASAPAPAVVLESARPSHYRLVAIDERRAEAVFEPVTLAATAADDEKIAIQRQSGAERLVLPIDRLSSLLDGDGVERAVEIEEGTLFDAFYTGEGVLERLEVHGD